MKKNWKNTLILLLVLMMALTLGGCKMKKETNTNVENQEQPEKIVHHLALTDMDGGIRVIDLDATNPTADDAIVWEWKPSTEKGWTIGTNARLARSVDDVKLRWSEYYQKEVVIMTASNNWAGIADYETGECLWEAEIPYMPHGIEMLPNGDIVIAGSGGNNYMTEGCVMYYNITAGAACTQTDLELLSSAHGLYWDPDEEVIWVVGWDHLASYKVEDTQLTRVEDKGCRLLHTNGHDLSADFYDSDQLLVTTGDKVYKFSKEQNKLLIEYNYSDVLLNNKDTKGITSFVDGMVVYGVATGVKATYDTDTIYVIRLDEQRGVGVQKSYTFEDFSTYKMKNFTTDYQ